MGGFCRPATAPDVSKDARICIRMFVRSARWSERAAQGDAGREAAGEKKASRTASLKGWPVRWALSSTCQK